MSTRRLSRLVLLVLAGAVLLHCVLGLVVLATAGRFAWGMMAHHGSAAGGLGGITARLAGLWLAASAIGLAIAARLVRAGRLSL